MRKKNPFVVVGYDGPNYFCDRLRETGKMVEAIENDRNLTLIAPRRYGKTGLIHHVLRSVPAPCKTVYLDIFSTRNLTEFTRLFASAIVGALDSPVDRTLSSVARFFKSCRPTVTPQENGMPKFSFDSAPSEAEATLGEAFDYLKEHHQPVVVAIDEFQQILEYPEKGTEALLRGYIQNVPWVRFIFSGSRHHLMGEMFLSAKHPFYQSTDILSLDVIERTAYAAFARRHFEADDQPFDPQTFDALYGRFSGITWYVQSVLNRIWLKGEGLTKTRQIEEVVADMVADRALLFHDLYVSQNDAAQMLLSSIAADGEAREVYSGDFLKRHRLTSTSTIRSTLTSLVDADLVYRTETGYVVYDRLFGEYLAERNCRSERI